MSTRPLDVPYRWMRYVWLAVCVGVTACSFSPRMEPIPKQSVDLSGRWILDRRASDDVRARLLPQFENRERKQRKFERRIDDEPPAESAPPSGVSREARGDLSTLHWMQQQRQRESLGLIAMLTPATQIDIRQSPTDLRFDSNKGEGARVFVPGESSSLFVAVGGFKINSGWNGHSFIIESRGTAENNINLLERYTVVDSGQQVEEQLEARLPLIGKQVFHFVYKRAP